MRVAIRSALSLALVLVSVNLASAQDRRSREDRPMRESLSELRLAEPLAVSGVTPETLRRGRTPGAREQVIVRLRTDAAATARLGRRQTLASHLDRVDDEQNAFIDRCLTAIPNTRVIARVRLVLNAVFLEVDRDAIDAIASDPAVMRVLPVANYEMDLSETVPHIGADDVQALGFDGSGVSIAVLDSGIDYTHANLGGGGTLADYVDAYGTPAAPAFTTRDGLFPTPKVVEGWDFVGELWPTAPLAPDEDPIDFDGHGTHVADISGGLGGVAPGADLYAVKVCSSVTTSCSGVALIQGMEFAVDPNGDGNPDDHVDIVNMSLGSSYGQPFDDDLSAAVDGATALGVFTVASAANSADKPYASGTPAAADTALSVAQTTVPSAFLPLMDIINPPIGLVEAVFQPWSAPLLSPIAGPVTYGDGAGGNLDGCAPFAGTLDGIVFVDRGTCNFSDKIRNIANAGGDLGIIGLIAAGDPFPGGFGGGPAITIPGYMINQANGNALRTGTAVVSFDPAVGIPLSDSMVSSSARGPSTFDNRIKPEIGAPGASLSAEVGTGSGETAFGGTSGAAPMVSGAAALMMQAYPGRSAMEIKAALMNTGATDILNTVPGDLAPISRIGGGEVRVNRSVDTPAAAWDWMEPTGSLGFGLVDVARKATLIKWVNVRNYSSETITYNVAPSFRFADDELSGAVELLTPPTVMVRGGRDKRFPVFLKVDAEKLPGNFMSSGVMGASSAALTINEYDGYLTLDDGESPIHMPWHAIPRKASRIAAVPDSLSFFGGLSVHELDNSGVGTGQIDAYSLLAVSDDKPRGGRGEQAPMPDLRAVGVNTFPVDAGFCSGAPSFVWVFAFNTWERQSHLVPVIHNVFLDIDQDGVDDFNVFNFDLSFSGAVSDGRQVTWAFDLVAGGATAFFFTEHATNSGNTTLTICAEQVGMSGADLLTTNVNVWFLAQDFYFGGPGDAVPPGGPLTPLTITPFGEQYVGVPSDVPALGNELLGVFDFGLFPGNTPELGTMLITNGDRGAGNRGAATEDTEALLLFAAGGGGSTTTDASSGDGRRGGGR